MRQAEDRCDVVSIYEVLSANHRSHARTL